MSVDAMLREFPRIAAQAGRAIMDVRRTRIVTAAEKSDGSPVTEADRLANRAIGDALHRHFPGIPVISEEDPGSHVIDAEEYFLVDPLDGTRGFIAGRDDFTVNIAYLRAGQPIAGVVHEPARGCLIVGAATHGVYAARVADDGDVGTQRCIGREGAGSSLRVVLSRHSDRTRCDRFLGGLDIASINCRSSSLKFCMIVADQADIYPRFGQTMEWDTAAGHALLIAIGGCVLDIDALTPLRYGKPGRLNEGFVACAAGIALPHAR